MAAPEPKRTAPSWRIAGPVSEGQARILDMLTCAAVGERIRRRVAEWEAQRRRG